MHMPALLPAVFAVSEGVRRPANVETGLITPQGCNAFEWIGCAAAVAACGAFTGPGLIACVAAAAPGCVKCVS